MDEYKYLVVRFFYNYIEEIVFRCNTIEEAKEKCDNLNIKITRIKISIIIYSQIVGITPINNLLGIKDINLYLKQY